MSNLIVNYQQELEYRNCHKKEIQLYELLHRRNLKCIPNFYGALTDDSREVFVLLLEFLKYNELQLFNSENNPEKWSTATIRNVIKMIHDVHRQLSLLEPTEIPKELTVFEPWKARDLYVKLAEIIIKEYRDHPNQQWQNYTGRLLQFMDELKTEHDAIRISKTIIHNDFNPRNITIRQDGSVCIYDWELAVIDFPHRDIVEFLSFVLPESFDAEVLRKLLDFHYSLQPRVTPRDAWKRAYSFALKEYLVTRVSFYLTGRIILEFEFAERIFLNAFRMFEIIEDW